ncbi:sulfotransferase [Blastococcus deserti]|uniref:Sulfotransferase n=1 Tax=Blastococcus deserti TaxID=2259033 RepID=A0ABW4X7Y2_9ACTN
MSDRTIPTFLVAGAARSGTTGLVEGLRSNPAVFVTSPKEPHYFALHGQQPDFRAPGDAQTINSVAVTDRQAYLDLYPRSSPHLALGDASVSTLYYHERALPEIRALNPDMRVVVLLREPVERAYSSHQYLRARGFEPCEDFLAAVAEEPRRRAENWHHLWHYTAMSQYSEAVAALQAELAPGHLGIWFYDDLERDFAGTVSQVLRFIGVPPVQGEGEQIPRVNTSGKPRFEPLQRAIWWATRHEALRSGVKRVTSFRFRERVRRMTLRREGPPAEAYAQLRPLFADDLARLRKLLPEPHPAWLATA